MISSLKPTLCSIALVAIIWMLSAQIVSSGVRSRDLGIPFDGVPGPFNAITDVAGVEVGYVTLIRGEGKLVVGQGPVRTGVTAIHPRGKEGTSGVFASRFTMNGDGEMTGTHWIDEFGTLYGPILLTNTSSVGDVHKSAIDWMRERKPQHMTYLPVVAETWDADLNDMHGYHVQREHVFAALDGATTGPLAEGNVGGGTGMTSHGFKAGTGTSSRRIGKYTVGVLVQANHGLPWRLTIAGVPVGEVLSPRASETPQIGAETGSSIIVIVATDAPLLPQQLERLAKRPAMGIARIGGIGERSSGEIFLAFSTANEDAIGKGGIETYRAISDDDLETLDYLYEAVIQATEEAIVNALVAAETMVGVNGTRVESLDHERLRKILRDYGRLVEEP